MQSRHSPSFFITIRNIFLFLIPWVLVTGWCRVCPAAELEKYERMIAGDAAVPWRIQADEVVYNEERGQYEARGNVVISQDGRTVFADHVTFDMGKTKLSVRGNVVLNVGDDVLRADAAELDLNAQSGVLTNGEVFLKENHFTIAGDRVAQLQPYVFSIENAAVTSCSGDAPTWRITGKNVDVTLNGYGFVRHAALWVKDIPVFYMPYFIFPVMLDRQTGLLIPKVSLSDRKGFQYDQPLYWAISGSTDATFYNHYMAKRGNKIGLEYRYALDGRSRGTLMWDYLDDRKIDDGSLKTSDYGYDHDNWIRDNTDRYWFRMKADQGFGEGFRATLDVDIVSDQDVLLEFRDGHSGFTASNEQFTDTFGRDLDSYEDPVRVNRLNVNKTGLYSTFNAGATWYDDVIVRRYLDDDNTVQNLPQIRFSTSKLPIFSSSFHWQSDSEYTYLFSGDGTRGHRIDVHPKAFLPGYANGYFSVEPSVGIRETFWQVDTFDNSPLEADKDRQTFRHLFDARVDARSEVYRIYSIDSDGIRALKHAVVPRITYQYIPDVDQDEPPWFDGIADEVNRIEKTNGIFFGLDQYLTARTRKLSVQPKAAKTGGGGGAADAPAATPENYGYFQLLRFSIMQGYDVHEARADDPAEYRNGQDRQPFLPLDAELDLNWNDAVSIAADAQWNHYDNRFDSRNIEMTLCDDRGDRINMEYRYADNLVEFFSADVGVKLSDNIYSYADYEHDLVKGETLETNLGFIYDAPCWMLDMRLSDEDDDRKIAFMVTLKGLGEIGNE